MFKHITYLTIALSSLSSIVCLFAHNETVVLGRTKQIFKEENITKRKLIEGIDADVVKTFERILNQKAKQYVKLAKLTKKHAYMDYEQCNCNALFWSFVLDNTELMHEFQTKLSITELSDLLKMHDEYLGKSPEELLTEEALNEIRYGNIFLRRNKFDSVRDQVVYEISSASDMKLNRSHA